MKSVESTAEAEAERHTPPAHAPQLCTGAGARVGPCAHGCIICVPLLQHRKLYVCAGMALWGTGVRTRAERRDADRTAVCVCVCVVGGHSRMAAAPRAVPPHPSRVSADH
ncbi:hypothetical protein EON67_10125 [archaeon]|nr:MAG: hypothetical protein EON67_10125 [archaeon]